MRYLLIALLLGCVTAPKPICPNAPDEFADEPKDPPDDWQPATVSPYVYVPLDVDGGYQTGPCRVWYVNHVKHEDCD